jgi:hypothetical protein
MNTPVRGLTPHEKKVSRHLLWISRDYLWISTLPCGEVPFWSEISLNPDPHIQVVVLRSSKIWIGPEIALSCG